MSPDATPAELWQGLLATMRRVDALPAEASGAFVPADETSGGMILIERKNVCWAVAPGMRQRLRDILRSHCATELDEGQLDAIFQRCREAGIPLGEALETSGLVSPSELRAALKEQTVGSLLALATALGRPGSGEWPLSWVSRRERGYNPRFTFTTAEVLAAVGARLVDQTEAAVLSDHLEGLATTGSAAVAFCGNHGAPVFVGLQSPQWLTAGDLVELSDWAAAALDASPGFSPVAAHAFTRSAPGGTVAWHYEHHRCAAVCPTMQSLQRLVVALGNQDVPMVLATRLSVLERVREKTERVREMATE